MLLARTKTSASCGISPLGDFVNSEAARILDGITPGRASCPPDISRGSKEKNLSYHDEILSVFYIAVYFQAYNSTKQGTRSFNTNWGSETTLWKVPFLSRDISWQAAFWFSWTWAFFVATSWSISMLVIRDPHHSFSDEDKDHSLGRHKDRSAKQIRAMVC